MIPEIKEIPSGSVADHVAPDELLIVLGAPSGDRAAWVRELVEKSAPSLARTTHYLRSDSGFLSHDGLRPYTVLSWQKLGVSALERRWVAHKMVTALTTQFNLKKIAVYLEAGSGPAELAIVEDLWTRKMTPRYERSELESLRILTSDAETLKSADPHYDLRLRHQLGFRRWVNENPDELTSVVIGERLEAFCRRHGCEFNSFGREGLTKLGMNLLLAVGQASDLSPSRFYLATHRVMPGSRPLLLVGKGITFDTGGINLKPHEGHVNCMKNDMGGAGLMVNLFMALVESGYDGPLAVAIPCCENLIGERSVKPGAIIRSFSGKDVIIEHTDAEGRLILADAISYSQRELNPAQTLVAATLTTASLRQFTNFFTPVHFAPQSCQDSLQRAGRDVGEEFTFWGEFLPFLQGNSHIAADLTNMGRMPKDSHIGGGSNVAAHFLKEFATLPMIHFDIFASTWNWSGDYPGANYGATGAPFNAMFRSLSQDTGAWVGDL
ncbi:MAG: M17 family metallopeptidase [Proteobacteria bacterium]|nr:M17 family metallopeptidase [Pseudomonadota bacterium]